MGIKPSPRIKAFLKAGAVFLGAALVLGGCEQPGGTALDSDATLASLTVDAGYLDPAFSPELLDYAVVVANGVSGITVSARAASPSARISNSAAGGQSLSVGDNRVSVRVTAESGASQTYTLGVKRLGNETISIGSVEEFAKIGVDPGYPPAGNYVLGADLTLTDWTPAGWSLWESVDQPVSADSAPFSGVFDGAGHTLTLKSINAASCAAGKSYLGIFSAVRGADGQRAVIKNLNILSSLTISSAPAASQAAGLLAGYTENAHISNITLAGSFNFTSTTKNIHLGGMVGYAQRGTVIENSSSSAAVTLTGGSGGGFVKDSFYNFAGGFVGIFKDGVEISGCHMTGAVTGHGSTPASQIFAGGIAGGSYYAASTGYQGAISYCSNRGDVFSDASGLWTWTGGIAGCITGGGDGAFEKTTRIYRSWASGTVASSGGTDKWPYTGGIAGCVYYGAMVAECYFTGDVTAKCGAPGGKINDYAGGIAGYLSKETGHNSVIRDCWSSGSVTGYLNGGGIAGQHQVAAKLYNCWSKAVVTVTAGAGAAGSSSQQGAGGIAGFCASGGGGEGAEEFAGALLYSCAALNPSVSAPGGFERLGRVAGDGGAGAGTVYAWSGMSVTAGGAVPAYAKRIDGDDCAEKPDQALYAGMGWDFAAVWTMGGDGYPHLRWE